MSAQDAVRRLGVALLASLGLNLLLVGFVVGRDYLSLHDRSAAPAAIPGSAAAPGAGAGAGAVQGPGPSSTPGAAPGAGPGGSPPGGGNVLQRVQGLPPAERQRFRQAVRPYQPGIAAARAAQRAAEGDLAQALRAAPYDKDAVRAAFARLRDAGAHAQELAQQAAVEGFAALDQPSREALAGPPAR